MPNVRLSTAALDRPPGKKSVPSGNAREPAHGRLSHVSARLLLVELATTSGPVSRASANRSGTPRRAP